MSRRNEMKALEERVARLEDLAGVKPAAKGESSGNTAARSTKSTRRRKATKKAEG